MKSRNPLERFNSREILDEEANYNCNVRKVLTLLIVIGGPYLLICSYFYFLADEDLDVLMQARIVLTRIDTGTCKDHSKRDTSNKSIWLILNTWLQSQTHSTRLYHLKLYPK